MTMTNNIWFDLLKLINEKGSLSFLKEEYQINISSDEELGLHCLKYSVFSPKTHWVTRACRGTVLSEDKDGVFSIEAVGFERFFNLGEAEELQASFDWNNVSVQTKHDGSLIKLFYSFPLERWVVSTSGTPTGKAPVGNGFEGSFAELFWQAFPKEKLWALNKEFIYVYELITPYNRVVVDYKGIFGVRLLTVRDKVSLQEIPLDWEFKPFTPEELLERVKEMNGLETEGFILVDKNLNRIKLKCPSYVALHREVNNGEPDWFFLWKGGELEEFVTYFPHHRPMYNRIIERIEEDVTGTICLIEGEFAGDVSEFAKENNQDPHFHFAMALLRNKAESVFEYICKMNPKAWKERYVK